MIKVFDNLVKLLDSLEKMMIFFSGLSIFSIMIIVSVDVFMRYALNAPLGWPYEIIEYYLLPLTVFFAISITLRYNEHVYIDLLHYHITEKYRRVTEVVTNLAVLWVFMIIAASAIGRAITSYRSDDAILGNSLVLWPTWISYAIVGFGTSTFAMRIVIRAIGHILSLATSRSILELPDLDNA